MKIMSAVGARPNFMKISPIVTAIRRYNEKAASQGSEKIDHVLVHTGQHYDQSMSGSFFNDLNIPEPDIFLGVGSGTHASQTAEIIRKFEPVLLEQQPDVLLVVGDVNSTVACALVASKIIYPSTGKRPLIAHVEGGLRSFDRLMPEEVNRILTDHISDFLFITEQSGIENLKKEGISDDKIFFVGNTMIDTLLTYRDLAAKSTALGRFGLKHENGRTGDVIPYALVTLHRPSNVDSRDALVKVVGALSELSREMPVVFPIHPRTLKRISEFNLDGVYNLERLTGAPEDVTMLSNGIYATDPLGYLDFLCLMSNARIVLTDSGGIQEETTCLGVPCVTVRENTERPVTVSCGTNVICGSEPDAILNAARTQLARTMSNTIPEKWDGHAAERILDILVNHFK
ncbi:MAG: non-hydrolyzing UDP-N-acetylglucosamine 2-epimerase [Syntrophobacteraceae bacterium]